MREKKQNAVFLCLYVLAFAAACAWILNKARYGFAGADESFYLTIPLRLVRGDGLFLHEWHLSQMASFLILPIMYPYMKLVGTTVGIALAFRYIFTVVWIVGGLFVFLRLRRVSLLPAAAASLIVVLYTPFGIMALSYNSLGVLNMMLSVVLLCTAKKNVAFLMSGVFFAAAVLCCPYLAAVYVLYTIGLAVYGIRHRDVLRAHWKQWMFFTLGVAALAVLFAAFVFSRASLSQIADAIPQMLLDPEHKPRTLFGLVRAYFGAIALRNIYFAFCVSVLAMVLFVTVILRKQPRAVLPLYAAVCAGICLWIAVIWRTFAYPNLLMLPLQVLPLFAVLVSRDERVRKWFLFGYLPVMAYTVCVHLSSNQAIYVISSVCMAAMPATVLMFESVTRQVTEKIEHDWFRRMVLCAVAGMFALQVGTEAVLRYLFTFREEHISTLTEVVEYGPEKGLLTTPEKKERYEQMYAETKPVREDANMQSVLYLSEKTYLNLMEQEAEMAAYSAWLSGVKETTLARLDAYYERCPDKVPQAIFYDKDAKKDKSDDLSVDLLADWAQTRFGLSPQVMDSGDIWFLRAE